MNRQQVKAVIERVAREVIEVGGPSFAQEQIVLRKVADEMRVRGRLDDEQFILTCWNELFRDGVLSWGYNMENPSRPWFHFSHA